MVLVGYSDSESEDEGASNQQVEAYAKTVKGAGAAGGPRKIKVDLPPAASTTSTQHDFPIERPQKRARTGNGLSDFNSMLPAPKRTGLPQTRRGAGLGSGVNLKTSGAAAFSREPLDSTMDVTTGADVGPGAAGLADSGPASQSVDDNAELKIVGNPMRFKPLSVANKKRGTNTTKRSSTTNSEAAGAATPQTGAKVQPKTTSAPMKKAPTSLFAINGDSGESRDRSSEVISGDTYDTFLDNADESLTDQGHDHAGVLRAGDTSTTADGTLSAIANDLNLSAADRRRLFGRGGAAQFANVTDFNMDREYSANEKLRAAGEEAEHRAVKAVAPGKHSLQQLVNASTNQREALEDKWAEGKRNRGEAGDKYGWGGR